MFSDNYVGIVGQRLNEEQRQAEAAARRAEQAQERIEARGDGSAATSAHPDLSPEYVWSSWGDSFVRNTWRANRAYAINTGMVTFVPNPRAGTVVTDGRDAGPVRDTMGDHPRLGFLIEPVRVADEPQSSGPYWAWLDTIDYIRYESGFARAIGSNVWQESAVDTTNVAGSSLATTQIRFKPGKQMRVALRGTIQRRLVAFNNYLQAWFDDSGVTDDEKREHLYAWAEAASMWVRVNEGDMTGPDHGTLSGVMGEVFSPNPQGIDWAYGATLNGDGDGDYWYECDDCGSEVTECTCQYDVDVYRNVYATEYASVSVPRRDSNGKQASESEAGDDAADGNHDIYWNSPDEWDSSGESIEVNEVSEGW